MDFAILPPEINSGRMYAGPGSGPMLAAAAAWDGLAAELQSTAASYASVISGLTAGPWLGPASASMVAAAGPYAAWMSATGAQAEQTANQATSAAAAYEVAFAATVPPQVIAANRALLMALVATNLFGQNTPAIAATETLYAEMWAQDATAMTGYASASATASTLTPFTPPPQTTNAAGLTGQAAAVVQAASTPTGASTQTIMSAGSQLMSLVPRALQGLASPVASDPPTFSLFPSSFSLLPSSALQYTEALTPFSSAIGTTSFAISTAVKGDTGTLTGGAAGLGAQGVAPATGAGGQALGWAGAPGSIGSSGIGPSGGSTPVTAGLGRAALIGGLTVPSSWTAAAPAIRLAAVALPATGLGATPEVFAGSPGILFSEMAVASMAGRAIGGSVSPRRRELIGATTGQRAKLPEPQPANPVTGVAADHLRGLALAVLHDAGILTDEEFTEKRRLVSA
jgi:PPE-repeat protein